MRPYLQELETSRNFLQPVPIEPQQHTEGEDNEQLSHAAPYPDARQMYTVKEARVSYHTAAGSSSRGTGREAYYQVTVH